MPLDPEEEAARSRVAARQMRADIHRILCRWDPLSLKGLRGWEREYEPFVGDIFVLVKKGAEKMEIGRHLLALMEKTWGLPGDRAKCVDIGHKFESMGVTYRQKAEQERAATDDESTGKS